MNPGHEVFSMIVLSRYARIRTGPTGLFSILFFVAIGASLPMLLSGCAVAVSDGGGDDNDNGDNTNVNDNGTGGPSGDARQVFAVIGDYGDDDDNTREVADMVKSWQPDFIITTGDNDYSDGAYRGTSEGLELAVGQYFHEYIGNYQGGEGPGASENRFFPTPGDHDWGDTCDDPDGLDDYLAYFTLPDDSSGNERYYEFTEGAVHFISVHSIDGCEPDGVTVDSAQAAWARDALLASTSQFNVVYFHNPPYSSGERHVDGGVHMRWPWDEWGADLVLSGDDHIYERIERDGVTYIVNGLGGLDLHDLVDTPVDGSITRFTGEHGAMRIEVFDDRLEASFITVSGTTVETFVIERDGGGTGGSTDVTLGELDPDVAPVTGGDWYRPGVDTTWQWQLQPGGSGGLNVTYDVAVYDIDLFDVATETMQQLQAEGRRVVCYFSAGSYEDFREDSGDFLPEGLGATLSGFADERWLDVRSANVQQIMLARLDLAAEKGCDGVEPDNVDGYANTSGFDLTATDQLAFNRFIANAAHDRGLAVGLKNDLDQIGDLVDYFDFSVNEQCHEYDECDLLGPFVDAGKPVFNAEYASVYVDDAQARGDLCADALARDLRTLVLPGDLDDSFRLTCEP